MNKNQLWLIAGITVLLCLCLTLLSGGAFLWLGLPTDPATIAEVSPPQPTASPTDTPSPQSASPTDAPAVDNGPVEAQAIYSDDRFEQFRAVFDGAGVLHVFVRREVTEDGLIQSEELFHLSKTPEGIWSEGERLPTDEPEAFDPELVQALVNPAGQVCLVLYIRFDVLLRCLQGGAWPDAELIYKQPIPEDTVVASAPDGSLHQASFSTGSSTISVNEQAVPNGETDELVKETTLLIDNTGYHLAWSTIGGTLRYVTSPDNGQTWSNVEILAEDETKVWAVLRMERDGQGGLHLVWTGNEGIFYRHRPASGEWTETAKLGRGLVTADLAVDTTGLAHVAWGDDGQLVYMRQNLDGTWPTAAEVAQTGLINVSSQLQREKLAIAIDGQDKAHFVWVGEDGELYYGWLP